LFKDLVEELMLGLLPPFRLLIGFRSRSLNRVLLFRGWITLELDVDSPSSLPLRRFLVISLDKSLILVKVVRGLSGGKLVALEAEVPRIVPEDNVGLELARLDLLAVLLLARRSNTLELLPLMEEVDAARPSLLFDSLSIIEFLRTAGFLRSFNE